VGVFVGVEVGKGVLVRVGVKLSVEVAEGETALTLAQPVNPKTISSVRRRMEIE